jgi:hypothetical protein
MRPTPMRAVGTVVLLGATALLAGCGSLGSAPGASASATLLGQVLAAPSCPVERAESPCAPRPVPGATVQVSDASGLVSATSTDPSGRFSIVVPGGSYLVRATNAGGYRSTAEQQVKVAPGATASVRLVVDSGIR